MVIRIVSALLVQLFFVAYADAEPRECTKQFPCIGTVKMDCSSYGDRLYERKQKGESLDIHFQVLNHGPAEPLAPEHIANLLDSDFVFYFKLAENVIPPRHDISKLTRVAPLGEELLDEFFTTEIVGGPKMIAATVFGLPDRAVNKVQEGAFWLERFSKKMNGEVRSFNIVMLAASGLFGDKGKMETLLRSARAKINLTDEQMHAYGVQFAVKDERFCRTLSYAPDHHGRIGLAYSDGFGNVVSDELNRPRVAVYGESAQRKIWHTLRGKTEGSIEFQIRPDIDNLGLVSVLEENLTMISRTVSLDLVEDTFEKIGPNNLSFGEVAKYCTNMVGLKNYDEYQKRGDGRYPAYYEALIACMQNSNFKKTITSYISPIRTRLTLLNPAGQSKDFYVRKYRSKADKTFDRYRASELVGASSECATPSVSDFDSFVECLSNKRYQVVALNKIQPRAMFHTVTEAELAARGAVFTDGIVREMRLELSKPPSAPSQKMKATSKTDGTVSITIEK